MKFSELGDDDDKRAAEGDGIILSRWCCGRGRDDNDGKRAAEGDGIILSSGLWVVVHCLVGIAIF